MDAVDGRRLFQGAGFIGQALADVNIGLAEGIGQTGQLPVDVPHIFVGADFQHGGVVGAQAGKGFVDRIVSHEIEVRSEAVPGGRMVRIVR